MIDQDSNEQQSNTPEAGWDGQPAGMTMNQQPTSESRYSLLVTGLLVIIMVALSALWLRERSQRVKFQQQGVQLKKSLEEAKANLMFAGLGGGTSVDAAVSKLQLMAENAQDPQFEIIREDLATIPMTVNGKSKQVLQLSGTIGRRAGFLPGDMIYITEPPTTKPAETKQIPAVK